MFIVDGLRTPVLLASGDAAGGWPFSPVDLAVWAARPLLLRQPFGIDQLDEVILGCVHSGADEPNPGRQTALRLGATAAPGWTVRAAAASGLRALDDAGRAIAAGRAELVLAGGCDAHSRLPVVTSDAAVRWVEEWRAGSAAERARLLAALRRRHLATGGAALRYPADGGCEPAADEAADGLAYRFGIRREDADRFALDSHRRLAAALAGDHTEGRVALVDETGTIHWSDTGVQPILDLEHLAALEPLCPNGHITAGNRCRDGDGAAVLLLASEAACERWSLEPRARLVDTQWVGLPRERSGLGPAFAAAPLLERNGLSVRAVDAWEIDEAYAAEILAVLAACADTDFCRRHLGAAEAMSSIDRSRLNVDGGALALGRPLGAGGARIVLQLVEVLRRRRGRWGIAALAASDGQGGALLVESL